MRRNMVLLGLVIILVLTGCGTQSDSTGRTSDNATESLEISPSDVEAETPINYAEKLANVERQNINYSCGLFNIDADVAKCEYVDGIFNSETYDKMIKEEAFKNNPEANHGKLVTGAYGERAHTVYDKYNNKTYIDAYYSNDVFGTWDFRFDDDGFELNNFAGTLTKITVRNYIERYYNNNVEDVLMFGDFHPILAYGPYYINEQGLLSDFPECPEIKNATISDVEFGKKKIKCKKTTNEIISEYVNNGKTESIVSSRNESYYLYADNGWLLVSIEACNRDENFDEVMTYDELFYLAGEVIDGLDIDESRIIPDKYTEDYTNMDELKKAFVYEDPLVEVDPEESLKELMQGQGYYDPNGVWHDYYDEYMATTDQNDANENLEECNDMTINVPNNSAYSNPYATYNAEDEKTIKDIRSFLKKNGMEAKFFTMYDIWKQSYNKNNETLTEQDWLNRFGQYLKPEEF